MKAAVVAALAAAACASRPAAPIFDYHSVGAAGRTSEFDLTAAELDAQLDWLRAAGYHTLTLAEVVQRRNVERGVALTFDDGTADALEVVLPALQKRGMSATFFVVTGKLGTPGYLTWDGVRALERAGMAIGSHTVDHLALPDLPDDRAREELELSKLDLERHLEHAVDLFAYPYNSLRAKTVRLVAAAGYRIAVAGPVHGGSDPLRLYRLPVRRGMGLEAFQAAVRGR